MDKTHPLDIPEILSLIGSFVPAWNHSSKPHFAPQDLLSCTLVSKTWRRAMLPHLWAVYDQDSMGEVPIAVVSRYSVHFRVLAQSIDPYSLGHLWILDDNGQPVLKCTLLKTLTIHHSPTDLEFRLLSWNRGLETLKWFSCSLLSTNWESFKESIQPFAPSLRQLDLHNASLSSAEDLVLLLSYFPSLEQFSFTQSPSTVPARYPTLHSSALANAQDRGVRLKRLKTLVVSETFLIRDPGCFLGAIFRHCPAIERVCVEVSFSASTIWFNSYVNQMLPENTFTRIQRTLLQWRIQYRVMGRSAEEISSPSPIPEKLMDHLVVRINADVFHPGAQFLQRFERGFQDLVSLEACYHFKDERVLSANVFQFKDTLRHLSMDRLVFSHGLLSSRLLIQILRTCTALQTLTFNATEGFTLDQTLAIFQKQHVDFWNNEKGSGTTTLQATSRLLTADDLVPWACQHLENLYLGGLHQDQAVRSISDGWIIPATSPMHQWIAKETTRIGWNLRTLISCHIQHLPKLKSLRLNGISFLYAEAPGETS